MVRLSFGVFWDYENVRLPKNFSATEASNSIRSVLSRLEIEKVDQIQITERRLYYDSGKPTETGTDRGGLDLSGWTLVDCPSRGARKKETVDKKIIVDILLSATQAAGDGRRFGVVLISSDGDYAYMLNRLRDMRIFTVLVHNGLQAQQPITPEFLIRSADVVLHWRVDVLFAASKSTGRVGNDSDVGQGSDEGAAGQETKAAAEGLLEPPPPVHQMDIAEAARLLDQRLAAMSLKRRLVPGDGNCLYAAAVTMVSGALPTDDDIRLLRAAVADYLEDNRAYFENFLCGLAAGSNWEDFVAKVRTWGEWGDSVVLQAIADIQRRIIIVVPNPPGVELFVKPRGGDGHAEFEHYVLAHLADQHFDATEPLQAVQCPRWVASSASPSTSCAEGEPIAPPSPSEPTPVSLFTAIGEALRTEQQVWTPPVMAPLGRAASIAESNPNEGGFDSLLALVATASSEMQTKPWVSTGGLASRYYALVGQTDRDRFNFTIDTCFQRQLMAKGKRRRSDGQIIEVEPSRPIDNRFFFPEIYVKLTMQGAQVLNRPGPFEFQHQDYVHQ